MPNKVLVTEMDGTPKQIVFADHAGDFSPAAANDLRDATSGNRTNCQLSMASVASGSARQSAKADLGADRARFYAVRMAAEMAATPTAGLTIELWWNASQSATAGNANMGGCSGSDAAYAGYSSNLEASLPQLQRIGSLVLTAQATSTVQVGMVRADFQPVERYGSLVVVNRGGSAQHSDDVEIHVVFDPVVEEIQG